MDVRVMVLPNMEEKAMDDCKYKKALIQDSVCDFFELTGMMQKISFAQEEGESCIHFTIKKNYRNANVISVYDFCGGMVKIFFEAGYDAEATYNHVEGSAIIHVKIMNEMVL
jgi:hypothetical protein